MNTYSTSENNIESPLNYIGSKFQLVNFIKENLPEKIDTFIDLFAGGFNVGINITNYNKIIYNDYNHYVKNLIEILINKDKNEIIDHIEKQIKLFGLEKSNKDSYIKFRKYYNNSDKSPLDLYVLILFGFQHQIRFNSKHEFNNPVGRSGWNDKLKQKILKFNKENIIFRNDDFRKYENYQYKENDFVYCDPPYLITLGSYQDGKRGFDGWDEKIEKEFLYFLKTLDNKNVKFMLSNVLRHKDKKNKILINWIKDNKYKVINCNIKTKREEIIVVNY